LPAKKDKEGAEGEKATQEAPKRKPRTGYRL
jgi:hypothetical protein